MSLTAARTRRKPCEWYQKYLDANFILAIAENQVPSTKEPDPYMHIFIDIGGGNILAFFELPTKAADRPRRCQHPGVDAAPGAEGRFHGDHAEGQGQDGSRRHRSASARPTTPSSSRSTSTTRTVTAWSWRPTPATPKMIADPRPGEVGDAQEWDRPNAHPSTPVDARRQLRQLIALSKGNPTP